jgi:XTP/dITP diphosphohydrolase
MNLLREEYTIFIHILFTLWFNHHMKLVLATENPGKVREFADLLAGLPLELVTAGQLGFELHAQEDGLSFTENAHIKAELYAQKTGLLALADDSGLEVAALRGAPGLFSARFHPSPDATDADRRTYLLSLLQGYPQPWKARFNCSVCLYEPGGQFWHTTGVCKGTIIPDERGENGFGYDRIFQMEGSNLTMAELSDQVKNTISHRAKAVRAIIPVIERLIG